MLGRILEAAEGSARMWAAMARDVVASDLPDDPFDARDPDYIRETLPALRALSDLYFRGEVRGLDKIPRDEPVLSSATTLAGR
jgi:hypothetical protein